MVIMYIAHYVSLWRGISSRTGRVVTQRDPYLYLENLAYLRYSTMVDSSETLWIVGRQISQTLYSTHLMSGMGNP